MFNFFPKNVTRIDMESSNLLLAQGAKSKLREWPAGTTLWTFRFWVKFELFNNLGVFRVIYSSFQNSPKNIVIVVVVVPEPPRLNFIKKAFQKDFMVVSSF